MYRVLNSLIYLKFYIPVGGGYKLRHTIDLQKYLAGGVSTESPFLTGNGQPFEPDPDNAGGGKRAVHDILPFKGPLRGLFLSLATAHDT